MISFLLDYHHYNLKESGFAMVYQITFSVLGGKIIRMDWYSDGLQ